MATATVKFWKYFDQQSQKNYVFSQRLEDEELERQPNFEPQGNFSFKLSIKDLHDLGFRVKVRHQRGFYFELPELDMSLFITKGDLLYDNNGSVKKEINEFLDKLDDLTNRLYNYIDNYQDEAKRAKLASEIFNLDNRTGSTELSILQGDELLGVGYSIVNSRPNADGRYDHFCKSRAITISLGRALEDAVNNGKIDAEELCLRLNDLDENNQPLILSKEDEEELLSAEQEITKI